MRGSPLFNGRCTIRDAASGAAAADLELETAFAPATDEEKTVNDFLRRRGEGLNMRASVGAVLSASRPSSCLVGRGRWPWPSSFRSRSGVHSVR